MDSSIEHSYGYDYVTSGYKDNPQESWKQIVDDMHEMYPEADVYKRQVIMGMKYFLLNADSVEF